MATAQRESSDISELTARLSEYEKKVTDLKKEQEELLDLEEDLDVIDMDEAVMYKVGDDWQFVMKRHILRLIGPDKKKLEAKLAEAVRERDAASARLRELKGSA